jgi:DNA polymerase II small subunit/DNA polymerase delta subunit B
MAETKKSSKKSASKDSGGEIVFEKGVDHSEDKACPLLEDIIGHMESRIEELEKMIDEELNPLHRVELEAKCSEDIVLLGYLKSLKFDGAASKLLKAIFGE